jgi:hypothetical protein
MFSGDIHHYLPAAWGLKKQITVGGHDFYDDQGVLIEQAGIYSYWIAEVRYFQPNLSRDEVVVAVLRTSKWRKGVLIIPHQEAYFAPLNVTILTKPHTIKPVDLTQWEDPVAQALQALSIFVEEDFDTRIQHRQYSLDLAFATFRSYGHFHLRQGRPTPGFENLWLAVYKTIQHLAEFAQDAEVQRYVFEEIQR